MIYAYIASVSGHLVPYCEAERLPHSGRVCDEVCGISGWAVSCVLYRCGAFVSTKYTFLLHVYYFSILTRF